jgi:hypothetical protein
MVPIVSSNIGAGEREKVKHISPEDMQPLFPEAAKAA